VAGTQCMDKKETGFWIRQGNPKKLMVYLMGGGACFNPLCKQLASSNPKGFDNGPPMSGILRPNMNTPDEVTNPLGDHTSVLVPYCTGDVFLGNQDVPTSFGFLAPGKRVFKGRLHITKVMDSLLDSTYLSATLDHFVLTGESAGGFGGLASYDFLRTNYISNVEDSLNTHFKIDKANNGRAMLIDDSGIVMNRFHLTPCLTRYWYRLFNLETTIPDGCLECHESLYEIYPFLQNKYADDVMAFISTSSDEVITLFYAFGFPESEGECGNKLLPGTAPTSFKEGIEDFFMDYVIGAGINTNKFASYLFPGTDHTHSTRDNFFYKTQVFNDLDGEDIKLVDWYQRIVDGEAMDVESNLFEVSNLTKGRL